VLSAEPVAADIRLSGRDPERTLPSMSHRRLDHGVDAVHLHPLAYLLGLEGVALMRAFAGEYDADYARARIDGWAPGWRRVEWRWTWQT
jgi:hypothetical protein